MPGPVCTRELVGAARKGRSYALRSAYALVLLAALAASLANAGGLDHADFGTARMSARARDAFGNLVLVQGAAVLVLTPALVAGAVARETQRGTLGDLLTTDLNACEIVLGHLAARLLNVAVLVASGVPVLLLVGLIGGVDLHLILLVQAATLSTMFFLGALSVLGSVLTRSVRGALNFVFTLTLAWLVLPAACDALLPRQGAPGLWLHEWAGPLNAWIAPTSPFALWAEAARDSLAGPEALSARVLTLVGLQMLYGAALAALAVACLRPVFRAHAGGRRRTAGMTRPRRFLQGRPCAPCGDDPMLWKEVVVPRTPVLYRPLGLSVALVLGGLLVWGTMDFALPAFRELGASGYGVAPPGSARAAFHAYLRLVATGVSLVGVLGVASDAAAGVTVERERDTWVSLTATPLTGAEIVRGKLLGAIWGVRHTARVVAGLWVAGLAAGAVHPLGVLLAACILVAAVGFAAALGLWVSLRARDSARAVGRVMAILLLVQGGTALVALALLSWRPLALAGSAPALLAAAFASYGEVAGLPTPGALSVLPDAQLASLWSQHASELIVTCVLNVAGFAAAAALLLRSSCLGFDRQLDRPSATGRSHDTFRLHVRLLGAVRWPTRGGGRRPTVTVGTRAGR